MRYKTDIKRDLQDLGTMRTLAEIYGEIASLRMMKIRKFVLKNREFLNSINSVFQDALNSYLAKMSALVRSGKIKSGDKITFMSHNGKTVAVLISANTGYFGEVIQQTFSRFLEEVRDKKDIEVTIIGSVGPSLFTVAQPGRPYTFFELPDYGIDESKLAEVIRHLVQYDKIAIYYGKYKSVVDQEADVSEISAGTRLLEESPKQAEHFIFEPNIEKILMFFETQIFASLFDQTIRESQLAKFSSRIMAMDEVSLHIRQQIKLARLEQLRLSHSSINKKQLGSLASVMFAK